MSDSPRKIIHCDCDCFYAAIEIRDNPELAGQAVAVGGHPERRGVIATCNYEARKYGIHSAMASATARKRCPQLIIIRPDIDKYRQVSSQVLAIFRRYTALIEPLSLDEAYLDVSHCREQQGSATRIAERIRAEAREKLGITLSAGIAPNKFLAKVASDWNKPDGQFVVEPEQVESFVAVLPVRKLSGVGKVTAARMKRHGMETCGDLRELGAAGLRELFGTFGERLHELCLGIDERPVQTERIRKSVSVENTYARDLPALADCLRELPGLMTRLEGRLERLGDDYVVHKQFVKIKFHDFVQTTVEMVSPSSSMGNYRKLCEDGFNRGARPVRLLGLGVRLRPVAVKAVVSAREDQLLLGLEPDASEHQA